MSNNSILNRALCFWGILLISLSQTDGFSVFSRSQTINGARQSFTGTELQMAWYKPRSIRKAVVGSLQVDEVKHPNGNPFRYNDDSSATLSFDDLSSSSSNPTFVVPGIGSDWPSYTPDRQLRHSANRKIGEQSSNVFKIILNAAIRICYLILGPELFFRMLQFCKMILSVRRRPVQELR
mmetsp:Transcript_14081/g.21996  ORF Transcript_14081/g.21996 Transcript_14081/m.21996 type:complete len:180 (-) Transcript_14081:116-655(-)